jgi:hypothetical protein
MFRALVLFAFAAVAAAFAPSARVARSSSSLKMVFAQGLPGGAGPELKNFDPLKFSEKSPEWTLFFREAELKHGRICMLATLGWIVGDIHHPVLGVSSFEAHAASVSQGGLIQVLIWVSILEHISIIANRELGKGREPGDFAFDPCVTDLACLRVVCTCVRPILTLASPLCAAPPPGWASARRTWRA